MVILQYRKELMKKENNINAVIKCNSNKVEETIAYLEMLEEYIRKNNELIDEVRQEAIEVSLDEALGNNAIKIDLLISNIFNNLDSIDEHNEEIENYIIHNAK